MSPSTTPPPVSQPVRRPLKIYAFDPMRGRAPLTTLTVEVENEPLDPGPQGSRVRVVDYDGVTNQYYAPVNLDDPAILIQGGLEPTETNPRFHQQMVYAVAMRVLENFDRALGRRFEFRRSRYRSFPEGLTLFPHAFRGANAFFDPRRQAICFGYFSADANDPGPNLPGQTVFSCLSHDVIAHETSHAIVNRLRPYFLEPSNRDVLAFHEGFSDIVAIFQHFSFREVLRDAIQRTRGDLRSPNALIELASQFGYATGQGAALRSAIDRPSRNGRPDEQISDERQYEQAKLYETVLEPHERGSILVAAVFDAFFATYQERIQDLLRIATGGTGRLPEGDLHPDLVNRIAAEASAAAQTILTMCIRAFDYLPPVDVTYGSYLRALVTADFDLMAEQGLTERRALIESFRLRGIYPSDVASLAEGSLLWPGPEEDLRIDFADQLGRLMMTGADTLHTREADTTVDDLQASIAARLGRWAEKNAHLLDLDPGRRIETLGFHPTFRVGRSGQLEVEFVAQLVQTDKTDDQPEYAGLPFRGGTTIIAAANGAVRYVISKPIGFSRNASPERRVQLRTEAERRRTRQLDYVKLADCIDARGAWMSARAFKHRLRVRDFRALHEGLIG